jgi:ATP/maltotriose-dependent transcriptional regulator MalT
VHALQGEIERARSEFAEFRRLPETYPVGLRWWGTMGQIALAAELLDDVEVAGAVYAALLPIAHYYSGDGSGGVFSHGAVARVVADAARVAGRHDDAVRLYPDAVAMNARIGARPFTALSRLGWAESLLARGRAEELPMAVELGRAAAAEFRRLDMPGPLTRAARVIEDGERARRAVSPLTEREAEVAALVAAALSNRQIAERLVLSERTVESHVRSILGKLGFTSRTEIATWSTWEGNGR